MNNNMWTYTEEKQSRYDSAEWQQVQDVIWQSK